MADENETDRDDEETDDAPAAPAAASTAASTTGTSSSDGGSSDDGDDDGASEDDSVDADQRHRAEERELQRDADQAAQEAENLRDDELPIAGLLGLERWVQFAFVAFAVFLVYVTDKLVTFGWEFWAEPNDSVVTAIAVAVALAATFLAYQNDRFREFATEVVTELSKVTWPTREETWYSTVVVLTASFIAAVYTGVWDALWSKITDLIYSA